MWHTHPTLPPKNPKPWEVSQTVLVKRYWSNCEASQTGRGKPSNGKGKRSNSRSLTNGSGRTQVSQTVLSGCTTITTTSLRRMQVGHEPVIRGTREQTPNHGPSGRHDLFTCLLWQSPCPRTTKPRIRGKESTWSKRRRPLPVQTGMFGSLTNGTSLLESFTIQTPNGSGRTQVSQTVVAEGTQVSQTVVVELKSHKRKWPKEPKSHKR